MKTFSGTVSANMSCLLSHHYPKIMSRNMRNRKVIEKQTIGFCATFFLCAVGSGRQHGITMAVDGALHHTGKGGDNRTDVLADHDVWTQASRSPTPMNKQKTKNNKRNRRKPHANHTSGNNNNKKQQKKQPQLTWNFRAQGFAEVAEGVEKVAEGAYV